MPNASTLLIFSTTAFLLILAPGPNFVYILTRGTSQGRDAALISALGLGCGVALHTLAATVGLSALLRSSTGAFLAVKYLGAAYLIYVGVRTWRDRGALALDRTAPAARPWQLVTQSITASITNPKTALFFLTFLPQFVAPGAGSPALQMITLGAIYMLLTVSVYGMVGLGAGTVGAWLRRSPLAALRARRAAGLTFIGLGLWAALPDRR
jgi:threonine/homoserine/homoserine lactone efflux protein